MSSSAVTVSEGDEAAQMQSADGIGRGLSAWSSKCKQKLCKKEQQSVAGITTAPGKKGHLNQCISVNLCSLLHILRLYKKKTTLKAIYTLNIFLEKKETAPTLNNERAAVTCLASLRPHARMAWGHGISCGVCVTSVCSFKHTPIWQANYRNIF